MLLVANLAIESDAQTCKNLWNAGIIWYSFESTQQALSNEHQYDKV